MGCTLSATDEADKKRSEAIDRTLAAEGLSKNNQLKLLLLGESPPHSSASGLATRMTFVSVLSW